MTQQVATLKAKASLAKKKKGRPLDGVLLLDKPQGMTSNFALQKVRRLFGAQKGGHTGSLDPLATGVLPICFGEATKYSRYLLDADKGYYTTATLGDVRTTGDSEGEHVSSHEVPALSSSLLLPILEKFKGPINQVPSMYSALKHQGRPLYEYARKGITIERPARPITIYTLSLDSIRENQLDLTVECSKGTYIRSLVEDIGQELGCGGHVSMLRRFKAGHFGLAESVTMETIEALANQAAEGEINTELDQYLLPIDSLLPNTPKVCLKNELSRSILLGQAVRIADAKSTDLELANTNATELVRLYLVRDETSSDKALSNEVFAGVVEITQDGLIQAKRLVNFNVE
jgi:tRNA pseudouridine55 synthase